MLSLCQVKEANGKQYRCFFELALNVIGGKWKPVILFHIAIEGVMRFAELQKSMPAISHQILTKQLRELERDGMIHRHDYGEVPPKVEYTLKAPAVKLIPILFDMRAWGIEYEKDVLSVPVVKNGCESLAAPTVSKMYKKFLEDENTLEFT